MREEGEVIPKRPESESTIDGGGKEGKVFGKDEEDLETPEAQAFTAGFTVVGAAMSSFDHSTTSRQTSRMYVKIPVAL